MCPPAGHRDTARSGTPLGEKPDVVRVWLLGGFRVSVGTRTIQQSEWRLRKAAALVKLLALAPGHRLHREQAMEALWPDSGRKAASNNLRKTLHAARRILDPHTGALYLASEDELLVLCPRGELWVDVDAFEEAVATARRSPDPAACRAALDLYAGELLPEDRYEAWAESRRQELRRSYLYLLVKLARMYEEHADYERSIEALRRVAAEEPTDEEAHFGLMRLHALSRRPVEALAQYERLREALSAKLGTEPGATSRRLRDEIAAGVFSMGHTPPTGTLPHRPKLSDSAKHNLPAAKTSFVGRDREMREVGRQLAMTRLLTLMGAGGTGKTRLALEVARDLVGAYPDGVWLVELAPLSEGELVPQAVAVALSVHEQPGQPLSQTLVDALRSREMLLILDNCEHLVEATASLVDTLLGYDPRLRVLATSREALGAPGEVRWLVPALSVLDPHGSSPTVAGLEGSESARLFAERARQRDPAFSLTPDNARFVAEICRSLDGIPLAIELAAARVAVLSVEQISERLEDSLGLLTGGDRTAVARQQTLRDTLEWSHGLLSNSEEIMFRRLSVFSGGWSLQAAEGVGAGRGIAAGEAIDLLSGLVDKSLVSVETNGVAGVRYRLLEPIRQYAREKLLEAGEAETFRRRHAAFFVALAEEAEPRLLTPSRKLLDSLEAEHDNLRAALSWSPERGEIELGLRIAGALRWFWFARGYLGEGRQWLEKLLRDGDRTVGRAKALLAMCFLANQQGDFDEAKAAAEEGVKLGVAVGVEGKLQSELLQALGTAAYWKGDHEHAKELYEEALALSREAGDRWGVSFALNHLGNVFLTEGDYERAAKLYQECLDVMQETGDAAHSAIILNNLAEIALNKGDHERATALSERASALFLEHGHTYGLESSIELRGWAALMREDYEEARASLKESVALCRDLGDKLGAIGAIEGLACSAAAQGRAEHAARLFGAVEASYEAVGYNESPEDRAPRAPYMEAALARIGATEWEAAFSEGKVMAVEEATEYALSEPIAPEASVPQQPSASTPATTLTRREEEIATLIARGLTNRQIASELVLSEHTVATHVRRILKKLELRSRAQIGSWLIERQSPPADLN